MQSGLATSKQSPGRQPWTSSLTGPVACEHRWQPEITPGDLPYHTNSMYVCFPPEKNADQYPPFLLGDCGVLSG